MQEAAATVDGARYKHLARLHRPRHPEPGGVRGHLPAARGAARPLPHEDRDRLPGRGRRGADARGLRVSGRRLHDEGVGALEPVITRDELVACRQAVAYGQCAWSRASRATSSTSSPPPARTRRCRSARDRAPPSPCSTAARARAALRRRDFVTPDDVKEMAAAVLVHRVTLSPEAEMEGTDPGRRAAARSSRRSRCPGDHAPGRRLVALLGAGVPRPRCWCRCGPRSCGCGSSALAALLGAAAGRGGAHCGECVLTVDARRSPGPPAGRGRPRLARGAHRRRRTPSVWSLRQAWPSLLADGSATRARARAGRASSCASTCRCGGIARGKEPLAPPTVAATCWQPRRAGGASRRVGRGLGLSGPAGGGPAPRAAEPVRAARARRPHVGPARARAASSTACASTSGATSSATSPGRPPRATASSSCASTGSTARRTCCCASTAAIAWPPGWPASPGSTMPSTARCCSPTPATAWKTGWASCPSRPRSRPGRARNGAARICGG